MDGYRTRQCWLISIPFDNALGVGADGHAVRTGERADMFNCA